MIVLLNFLLFRVMPGSPERILARNPNVSPAAIEQTRARWGLDKPLVPDQLVAYLASTVQGDLGFSFASRGEPVTEVIAGGSGPTLLLFGLGEVIAIVVGLVARRVCGLETRRSGRPRRQRRVAGPLLDAVLPARHDPAADLRLDAPLVPDVRDVTPGQTYDSPLDYLADFGAHLVLPVATVALGPDRPVLDRHALLDRRDPGRRLRHDRPGQGHPTTAGSCARTPSRTRCCPTVSLIAINLGYVVAGAITVEVVFNWPGLGTLTVEALAARDYPVLQGIFLFLSVSVVLANLLADIVYGRLDPRVRA